MEKKDNSDILKYMEEIIQREKEADYDRSYGTAILRNGMIIPIYSKFKMFRDGFMLFSHAITSENEEKAKEIIHGLNNGVLTNGAVTLDLSDVTGFVSADKSEHFPNNEIPLDDVVGMKGDSFLSN